MSETTLPDGLLPGILEAARAGIWVIDRDSRTVYVNSQMAAMLGYSQSEMAGTSIFDYRRPEDRPATEESVMKRRNGDAELKESSILRKDGSYIPVLVASSPLFDPGGDYAGAVAFVSDLSALKRTEQDLRKERDSLSGLVGERTRELKALVGVLGANERKYRSLLESAPAVIAMLDRDGRLLFINRTTPPITPGEVAGGSVFRWLPADQHGILKDVLARVFEKGETARYVSRVGTPEGKTRWFENNVSPAVTGGGAPAAVYVSVEITERKAAEEALLARSRVMAAVSDFATGLASIAPDADLRSFIVGKFRDMAGAAAAWLCDHDPAAKMLSVTNMSLEPRIAEEAERLLGADPASFRVPLSDAMRDEIMKSTVGRRATLTEVSFGAVPEAAGSAIQAALGVDRFIGVVFVLEGRLFGTLVLAMGAGTPDPPEEMLSAMAHTGAVSLRRRLSEEAHRESEERFRTAFEQGPLGMALSDMRFRYHGANAVFCDILGYGAGELARLTFRELTHPDHVSADVEGLRKLRSGEISVYRTEKRYIRKDGAVIWGRLTVSLLHDASGRPVHHLVMLEDITSRKRLEDAVRESEERYRSLVENASEGILLTAPDGRIFSANPAACRMLGRTEEEIVRLGRDGVVDTTDPRLGAALAERERTGRFQGEVGMLRPDGTAFPVLVSSKVFDTPGGEKRTVMLLTDLAERKRAEEALRASEEKYRVLFENAQIGMYRSKIDGSAFLDVNRKFAEILGFSREELVGTPSRDRWADPADEDRVLALLKERGGKVENHELRLLTKDGQARDVMGSMHVVGDGYVEGTIADITERKRAEEAVRRSERRYRSLFENMQEGYAHCRMQYGRRGEPVDWTILDVNNAFGRLSGLRDVVGKRMIEVLPALQGARPEILRMFGRVAGGGGPETREVDVSGLGLKPGWLNVSAFSPAKGEFVVVFTDITERKRAELAMRRALMRYELEDGRLYIAFESWPHVALEAFRDLLKAGYEGFALTRPAGADADRWERVGCVVMFLSSRGGPGALPPDPDRIFAWAEALPPGRAILVDRLDYLAARAGFAQALHLVHRLSELARLRNHIVILSVDPGTMNPREMRMLEKEGGPVEPLVHESVPEALLETMRHIMERNMAGVRPTLASLGRDLGLSKPTVRKRVRAMLSAGYVVLRQKGSGKTLEMTEKGRTVLQK
jgi:PAS domain S-box-containing protein